MGEAGKHLLFECVQSGCHAVLRGRRGTLWHSNLFDNVWKISKLEEVSYEMLVFQRFFCIHVSFSSRWLSCGVAVSMGEAGKPDLFECSQAGCYTLHTLHFTLLTPHSTLYTPHSFALFTPHSTLYTSHFPFHDPYFTLHTFTLHTFHTTLHTLHSTLHTLHSWVVESWLLWCELSCFIDLASWDFGCAQLQDIDQHTWTNNKYWPMAPSANAGHQVLCFGHQHAQPRSDMSTTSEGIETNKLEWWRGLAPQASHHFIRWSSVVFSHLFSSQLAHRSALLDFSMQCVAAFHAFTSRPGAQRPTQIPGSYARKAAARPLHSTSGYEAPPSLGTSPQRFQAESVPGWKCPKPVWPRSLVGSTVGRSWVGLPPPGTRFQSQSERLRHRPS